MTIGGIKSKFIETIIHLNGASGSSKIIDWDNGLIQKVAMTDDCTFTFTNPRIGIYRLFVNNGVFVYTATWPANIKWQDNTSPSFTANRPVLIEFYYDGTNYYGNWGEYY
jgi:hypothetical protein